MERRLRWWVDVQGPFDHHATSVEDVRQLWATRAGVDPTEHVQATVLPTPDFDRPLSAQVDAIFGGEQLARPLVIGFFLTGAGWAQAVVSTPTAVVDLSASDLSNALEALAQLALDVRAGGAVARCSFDEEPGEYRWIVTPCATGVRVEVRSFAELWGQRADDEGHLLLSVSCSPGELCSAVHDCLAAVLERHGEAGVGEVWPEWRFPAAQLLALARPLPEP